MSKYVYAYETDPHTIETNWLKESWKINNIQGSFIGLGQEWTTLVWKMHFLRDFFHLYHSADDVVILTDSRDVIYYRSTDVIWDIYKTIKYDLLFGAETHLFDWEPNDPKKYPLSRKYRYLNSGYMIGKVSAIRKMFNRACELSKLPSTNHRPGDDQFYIRQTYLESDYIGLDFDCQIFQNIWDEPGGLSTNFDLVYHGHAIENEETGTFPSIFHCPASKYYNGLSQVYKAMKGKYVV